jgi:hypothetical protein
MLTSRHGTLGRHDKFKIWQEYATRVVDNLVKAVDDRRKTGAPDRAMSWTSVPDFKESVRALYAACEDAGSKTDFVEPCDETVRLAFIPDNPYGNVLSGLSSTLASLPVGRKVQARILHKDHPDV